MRKNGKYFSLLFALLLFLTGCSTTEWAVIVSDKGFEKEKAEKVITKWIVAHSEEKELNIKGDALKLKNEKDAEFLTGISSSMKKDRFLTDEEVKRIRGFTKASEFLVINADPVEPRKLKNGQWWTKIIIHVMNCSIDKKTCTRKGGNITTYNEISTDSKEHAVKLGIEKSLDTLL